MDCGDRPERNKKSYEKTLETFDVIVRPFHQVYCRIKRYEFQAIEVKEAYLLSRTAILQSTSEQYVNAEDAKYKRWFKCLKEAMKHYHGEVAKFNWLDGSVDENGEPLPIPEEVVNFARAGFPHNDVHESYPNTAELTEVMKEIDTSVAVYNGT